MRSFKIIYKLKFYERLQMTFISRDIDEVSSSDGGSGDSEGMWQINSHIHITYINIILPDYILSI